MNNNQLNNLPEELRKTLETDRKQHIEQQFSGSFDWTRTSRTNKYAFCYKAMKYALAASLVIAVVLVIALFNIGRKIRRRRLASLPRPNISMVTPGTMSIPSPGSFTMSISSAISKINLYNARTGVYIKTSGLKPQLKEN